MASMTDTARAFFDACETGKGWDACKAYCKPDATFAAQVRAGAPTARPWRRRLRPLKLPLR